MNGQGIDTTVASYRGKKWFGGTRKRPITCAGWSRRDSIRIARERVTYLHQWFMWQSVSYLYPSDRDRNEQWRESVCRHIWREPWPATRQVLYFLEFMGVISGEESKRIQNISRYIPRDGVGPIYQNSYWDSIVNDERTREAKKAAGCSDWPRN